MDWLLTGLVAGAAIAIAGAAVVGTGGLAAVALVGGAAALGAGLGETLSEMSWAPKEECGRIVGSCARNVFINGRPAARAHPDLTMCEKHNFSPSPIATGSKSVFINGLPAARINDTVGCGAVIAGGSNNVYIGGGSLQTDPVRPEKLIPDWVHGALLVVGVGSAVVLGGWAIALVGLAGASAGSLGGAWLGGRLFGQRSDGQRWAALLGGILGGALALRGATSDVLFGRVALDEGALSESLSAERAAAAVDVLKNKWGSDEVAAALAAKRRTIELDGLLTDSEYLSLRGYTSDLYKQINPALRSGNSAEWDPVTQEAISGMKKLADNGYAYTGIVRRDATFTPAQLEQLFQVDGKFSDAAFLSTTSDLDGMSSFAGNSTFTIVSKTGVEVRTLSEYAHEAEVLFKPSTEFKVVSRTLNRRTGQTEILLEELP